MQSIPSSFFQTSEISLSNKYEAFKESIGVIFEVDKVQRPLREFDACIRSFLIGEIMLVECETVGQRFLRPSQMIAKDSIDHFLIQIFYSGFTSHQDSQDLRICNYGKILILDASKPWEAINSDFRNLTLVVPRRLLAQELVNEEIHHGRMLDTKSNPFAEILFNFMLSLDEGVDKINAENAYSLTRPSIDLIAAALNYQINTSFEKLLDTKSSYHLALRFQIKSYLDRNLNDQNLSMKNIAYLYDMSEESINKLFAQAGGFNSYLQIRRLERAYNRLILPENNHEALSLVALELGFESEEEFIRNFKEYYQMHPNDLKNQKQVFSKLSGEINLGRQWEKWFKSI